MRIDIDALIKGKYNNQIIWVCDYRFTDFYKKPIRHLKPTPVMVLSNDSLPLGKTIYYSESHLVPIKNGKLTKTIFSIFDNTGYRSYTGVPLNAFTTETECRIFFSNQLDEIIKAFDIWVELINDSFKKTALNFKSEQLENTKTL